MQELIAAILMMVNLVSPVGREMFDFHNPEELTQKDSSPRVELLATGDIILGRSVNATMEKLNNFTYPFEKIARYLRTGDITLINLESPLVQGCQPTWEGMTFCGNPRGVEGLKSAGVTVATIANNHSGNYGDKGIAETAKILEDNQIQVTGNGRVAIVVSKGIRFGFLGYNDVPGGENQTAKAGEEIKKLRDSVDVIVVSMHWGIEYRADPVERQRELGRAAIDAGADLVIGNHPHWVEGIEKYRGKLITYAHGNFVFDQTWSRETQEGVVGKYVFAGNKLAEVSFYPIIIGKDYQTRWATEPEARVILDRMKSASDKLSK